MEQRQEAEEINMDNREFVAQMIGRLREGAKMSEIFGIDSETMLNLEAQAFRLYRNGLFSRAQVAGRGVLALDEDRVLVRLIMGDMALEEYRFAEAIEHLGAAHLLAPGKPVIQARLGEALLKKGRKQRARKHLQAVVAAGDKADGDDVARCRVLLRALER